MGNTIISQERFVQITDTVIDKLEGGYYHPNMLADGRIKDSRYKSSGETMLGIDRANASATTKATAAWREFWSIIDNANAKNTWKWNFKGGTLYPKLRALAGQMMYPHYRNLRAKYLTAQAQQIVDSDPRLTFNFAYAAWNGEGWFKRFADPINKAIAAGNTNADSLVAIAVKSRTDSTNSLISQTGNKIKAFIQSIPSFLGTAASTISKNKGTAVFIGIAFLLTAGYIFFHNKHQS